MTEVKYMTTEEREQLRADVEALTGIPASEIKLCCHYCSCMYIMGMLMDEYIDIVNGKLVEKGMVLRRLRFVSKDMANKSKMWVKSYQAFMKEYDDMIVDADGPRMVNDYEVLRRMIEAFFDDKGDGEQMEGADKIAFMQSKISQLEEKISLLEKGVL